MEQTHDLWICFMLLMNLSKPIQAVAFISTNVFITAHPTGLPDGLVVKNLSASKGDTV